MDRYNKLNKYYKDKFGERVLKICVDGGFTCPNRDGSKSVGGCAFCSERGSGDHIKYLNVAEQVQKHLDSYRGERANKFIVYFQNFSNTYAKVEKLKEIYDSALISDKIIGLSIATRPDCISNEIVELLKSYKNKYYVMVELGLQTADEKIAKELNLCYTENDYLQACKILKDNGIDVVAHIMLGLPKENMLSINKTIDIVNKSNVDGIKIHNMYIVKNAQIYEKYIKGEVCAIGLEDYLDKLSYIIARLNPYIVVHRISGDAPKDQLVAPEWNIHKKYVLNGIEKVLKQKDIVQGCLYKKSYGK